MKITATLGTCLLLAAQVCLAADAKVRVLVTHGGHGFEQRPFWEMLDNMAGVSYEKAALPGDADRLKPGLQKQFDVLLMYDMVKGIKPEQQESFVALLQQGIGVVSWHHNLGAHSDWPEFTKIIGGKYVLKECEIDGKKLPKSSYAHGQDMKIAVAAKDHPIVRGVADFQIHDETYKQYYVAPGVKVLLTTDHPKNDPSIAWVHQYGKSRVCYFMLGHDSKAWKQPEFQTVLRQAVLWAAEKP